MITSQQPLSALFKYVLVLALLGPLAVWAQQPASAQHASAGDLMKRDLLGVPGKEVTVGTVEYPPGVHSKPHRHDAQVFVYVLQGTVKMQVKGGPLLTLGPGQTFYEGPNDIHWVSANASDTEPAKILVFMIKQKGKPSTRYVNPQDP
jgi:quercetin dioxygenase-like cupin family protein